MNHPMAVSTRPEFFERDVINDQLSLLRTNPMEKEIKLLHLEDDPVDVELINLTLQSAGLQFKTTWVKDEKGFLKEIKKDCYDLVLADYRIPGFDGIAALKITHNLKPELPFIFVSGTLGEDTAIECLTQGATDYVLKTKLARLIPAINRAITEAENAREKRQVEIALMESGEKFRAIAESAVVGIIIADQQGKITYCNEAACNIFCYVENEMLGTSISSLMPEELKLLYPHKPGTQLRITQDRVIGRTVETFGKRKNGESFPIEISISSWQTHDKVYFSAMCRDISYRKRNEEEHHLLSSALEAAANGIVITDVEGNITWANPAFTELTGFSIDEVIGKNPRIQKSDEHNKEYYEEMWQTILSGKKWHQEIKNKRADGSIYTEDMTISPVIQKDGKISHFVAIKQDISERKQHELEREALISFANAMRFATTRSELLRTFLNQILDVFQAEGSMFAILDHVSGDVVFEMGCGPIGEKFTGLRIPKGKGISPRVVVEQKSYINNNAPSDPEFYLSFLLGDSKAAASIPMIVQDESIGALWMIRKEEITENELNLLTAIANLSASAIHRVTLFEKTKRQLQQMSSLHQIDQAISSILDLKIILDILLRNAMTQLVADAASILLLSPGTNVLQYAAGIGFYTDDIQRSRISIGEGRAGTAAAERRILTAPDITQAQDKFTRETLLVDEKIVSHHVAPLIAKGQIKGVLEIFSRQRLDPNEEWLELFDILATQAAIAVDGVSLFTELQQKNSELMLAYDATIKGWSRAMDLRDKVTEDHTQRIVELTIQLAEKLGIHGNDLANIRRGVLLHDIGKIGVPDNILLKSDELTDAEMEVMKQHPTLAYEMLSPIKYLKNAIDIPYCHHEKWDGSGYPRGLKGEEIPLTARLFSVVDVWDSLTTDRVYRKAWSKEAARKFIVENSGIHFDPKIVELFLSELDAQEKS